MKKTTRSILVKLALLGLLGGGQSAGAEEAPVLANPPAEARILIGAELPTEAATPSDAVVVDGQPVPAFTPAESAEMLPDSGFGEMVLVPDQSVALDGGTWGAAPLGPCCAVCGGGDSCPPNWYTHQETRILARNWPEEFGLVYEDAFIGLDSGGNPLFTPQAIMSTRDAGFDVAAGYAATVGRYLGRDAENRDWFLEFSYWGLNDWRESRAVTGERLTDNTGTVLPVIATFGSLNSGFDPASGAPSISFPFGLTIPTTTFNSPVAHSILLRVGGFNRADEHRIAYQSGIHNYELNLRIHPRAPMGRLVLHPNGRWRRECRPGRHFSYLFGVRVMSLDERFDWRSTGLINTYDPTTGALLASAPVSAEYLVRTYNDLLGLQVGADLTYRKCKYTYGVRVKASPCINFASQVSRVVTNAADDPYATIPLDYRTSHARDVVTFIGEVGFVGTYRLRPNFSLRASYDLMWVTGLALASEQIAFQTDPPDAIDTYGINFYQGLTLGFEWIW